jgi:choline dehydrogenase-like flavoprotein
VTAFDADVCIVGAGPAGLALAQALAGSGVQVVLLEAGNDREAQLDEAIHAVGEEAYPQSHVSQTRAAMLGGTSGLWSYRMNNVDDDPDGGERGCRYAPMDPIDFESRPEIPHSGWPITRADLDQWYERAQPVCGLGRYDYRPAGWSSADAGPLPLDPTLVESQMFQFGPGSAWRGDVVGKLRSQPNVSILTETAVTRLETDPAGSRVIAVHYRRGETAGTIRARSTVLAAGGIENSRLLLLSDREVRGGLGNGTGQVGRYWMEHPQVRGGMLVSPKTAELGAKLRLYDAHWQGGSKVMAKLSVAPERMRHEGLLSTSALLLPREEVLASPAVQAFTALRSPTAQRATPAYRARLAARIAMGAPDLVTARRAIAEQPGLDLSGWAGRPDAGHFRVFEIVHQTEQSPDPDNRITLSGETDQHGRRMPILHWRWTVEDRRRITRSRNLYAEAFNRAGLGKVIQRDWDHGQPRMVGGNHHHLGGTRMSADPAHGVVDADTKVHGVANLFVAGSSVFPSGGSVNPTLTIVALSLRLADHLRQQLATLPD